MTGKKKAGGAERPGGSPPGDATPPDYSALPADLKARIGQARMRAALSVKQELVLLYWSIGRDISARQTHGGWGAKVIDRLARDLARDFPGMSGSSARNLKYMRAFAEAWPDLEIVQQLVAQLPWGHNVRCWNPSRTEPNGSGTRAMRSRMAGVATFTQTKSLPASTRAKAGPSPISNAPCQSSNPSSPSRF